MNGKNKVTEVATRLWKNSTKLDLCWVHTTLMQIQEHYDCESADRHIFTDFVWYGTTILKMYLFYWSEGSASFSQIRIRIQIWTI